MSFDLILCIAVALTGSGYVILNELDNWIDDPWDDDDDFGDA
jgi:hypothetical protein